MKRDWLQISTNVGVILGMLLLIYELNQSSNLARAQVVDSTYASVVSRNLALIGESPEDTIAKSIFRPEDLTEADTVVLTQFYSALLVSWMRNKDERGLGYFGRGYDEVIRSESYFLSTRPGRTWWSLVRQVTDPEIVAVVDESLAEIPPEGQKLLLTEMLRSGHADATP